MRVAVVGAGLCGVAFVVHLARQLQGRAHAALELLVINRKRDFARGMAYGTQSASHLLNVPAGRMSLLPDQADDFLNYLAEQGLPSDPIAFVPRSHFGNYLKQRFEEAVASLPKGVKLTHLAQEALEAHPLPQGGVMLSMSDGSQVPADALVMATGNFLPVWPNPLGPWSERHPQSFITDPWDWMTRGTLPAHWQHVLVVGTGLTMMDLVVEMAAKGYSGRITAVSRRGLLPQPHRGHAVAHAKTAWSEVQHQSPRQLLRMLRDYTKVHPGTDWRDGIASIREVTPAIWAHWSTAHRKQFLRHLRAYWDVHRHRCAPYVHRQVRALIESNELVITKGRVAEVSMADNGVMLDLKTTGSGRTSLGPFDAVFNCTGPSVGLGEKTHPLLRQMAHQKLIEADELKLGLRMTDGYRCSAHPGIYYLGPMLRANHWEATAVPELRLHAQALAKVIAEKI